MESDEIGDAGGDENVIKLDIFSTRSGTVFHYAFIVSDLGWFVYIVALWLVVLHMWES